MTKTTSAATPKLNEQIQQIRESHYYQRGVHDGLDWERYGLERASERLTEVVSRKLALGRLRVRGGHGGRYRTGDPQPGSQQLVETPPSGESVRRWSPNTDETDQR